MHRLLPLVAILMAAGCSFNEQRSTDLERSIDVYSPDLQPPELGFLRMASANYPNLGSTPLGSRYDDDLFIGWVGMRDKVLCELDSRDGSIGTDVFLPDDVDPDDVDPDDVDPDDVNPDDVNPIDPEENDDTTYLFDTTNNHFLVREGYTLSILNLSGEGIHFPTMGWVEDAKLLDEQTLLTLTTTASGCEIAERTPNVRNAVQLTEGTCEGGKIQSFLQHIWVQLDDVIFHVEEGALVTTQAGSLLSVDPASGTVLTGTKGTNRLTVTTSEGRFNLDISEGVLDAAIRGPHIVVLTSTLELVLFDARSGDFLIQQPYFGQTDIKAIELSPDGAGLIVTTGSNLNFYRVYSQ